MPQYQDRNESVVISFYSFNFFVLAAKDFRNPDPVPSGHWMHFCVFKFKKVLSHTNYCY